MADYEQYDWDRAEELSKDARDCGRAYFWLSNLPKDEDVSDMVALRRVLASVGVKMDVRSYDFGSGDMHYGLSFTYDPDKVERKLTRGAGPKEKDLGWIQLDEVRAMMKNTSMQDVAARLGVSRTTLYRRLKKAEEMEAGGEKNPYI